MTEADIFGDDDAMWNYHTKNNPGLAVSICDTTNIFAKKLLGAFTSPEDVFTHILKRDYKMAKVPVMNINNISVVQTVCLFKKKLYIFARFYLIEHIFAYLIKFIIFKIATINYIISMSDCQLTLVMVLRRLHGSLRISSITKTKRVRKVLFLFLAQREGFEPSCGFPQTDFEQL